MLRGFRTLMFDMVSNVSDETINKYLNFRTIIFNIVPNACPIVRFDS